MGGRAPAGSLSKAWFREAGRFSWFPGHMAKATREIRERVKKADLVLEVRDARIPFSSGNYHLEELFAGKRHMVVMNKTDLADAALLPVSESVFARQGQAAISVSATTPASVKQVSWDGLLAVAAAQLLQTVHEWICKECSTKDSLLLMVVGVPNCGKSSLINAMHTAGKEMLMDQLAQHDHGINPAKIGPLPGVTRNTSAFRIGSRPSMFVMDTPGVMVPKIADLETGLKLALTGAVKDSVVGEEWIALYMLAMMNRNPGGLKRACAEERRVQKEVLQRGGKRRGRFAGPADKLAGAMPTDIVPVEDLEWVFEEVLKKMANSNQAEETTASARLIAAQSLIKQYRQGKLGRYTWDDVHATKAALEAATADTERVSGACPRAQLYPRAPAQ